MSAPSLSSKFNERPSLGNDGTSSIDGTPPPDFYSISEGGNKNGSRGDDGRTNEKRRSWSSSGEGGELPIGRRRDEDNAKGMGWFVAGLFVVGDMAGGGLVALPTAMIQSGFYTGITLSFLMTLMFMCTSCFLGRNWVILRRRWPTIYRTHCRQPYPEMGRRALGPRMRTLVSTCIDINQFGTTVVYLLLAAKNIHDSLKAFFNANISFCLLLIILAILLLPVTFLNSPQDFWLAAVVAVCTTSTAVVLICIGSLLDIGQCGREHSMPDFHPANYFLAMGTLLFAYGGHSAFPTVQHDMRRPSDFSKSSLAAFAILFSMYTPVCIIGYLTYGNSLRESVINSLQHVWIQQIVNVMITVHLIFTILIVNNPLNQKAEEVFQVPHKFGWKRTIVRTGMMAIILFVAETVPTFGPLLDLIGGSVLMMTSLVFPCLFYLFLNAAELKANEKQQQQQQVNPINFCLPTITGTDSCGNGFTLEAKKITPPSIVDKKGGDGNVKEEEDGNDDGNQRASWGDVVERTDRLTLYFCLFIMVFGIIGGAAATFSAIRELSYTHFVPPCYLSSLVGGVGNEPNAGGHVNCCGPFQNISILGEPESCSPPNLNFYN